MKIDRRLERVMIVIIELQHAAMIMEPAGSQSKLVVPRIDDDRDQAI